MRRVALLAALATGLAACVGPARSFTAFEGKAGATAATALSAVQTARLTARMATRDRAFGPYVSVVLSESEEQASGAQGIFDSIQPPDAPSDDLRDELDDILTRAVGVLADLRITARRHRLDLLARKAAPLLDVAKDLRAFTERHPTSP